MTNDFSLDYIKKQYCVYKCPVKKDEDLNTTNCSGCDIQDICDKVNVNCADKIECKNPCDICQWDNCINELRDFRILK